MFYTIKVRKLGDAALAVLLIAAAVLIVRSAAKLRTVEAAALSSTPALGIDAGHGGIDGGAIAANSMKESDINLAIALKLDAMAGFCGVKTVMTRTDDSARTDALSYSEHEDLVHRTELINSVPNGCLISIHQNFYPTSQPTGAQVLYAAGEQSRRLGVQTHNNLVSLLQPTNRRLAEPAPERLFITSHAQCPAILVECGFMSNISDLDQLMQDSYQTSLAAVLLTSFLQFLSQKI